MKSFLHFTAKTATVMVFLFIVGVGLINYFQINLNELYIRVSGPPLNSEARKQLEDKSRLITEEYGAFGSGCEEVKGFVFTSRHLVEDVILDQFLGTKVALSWNDKPARVYSFSLTNDDYAIITTMPEGVEFPVDEIKFSSIEPKEGQILHTFSSPGDMPDFYQKLEVVKVSKDSKTKTPVISFKTDYTQDGISGGCVVDENGDFVGIIKKKMHYADPKAMQFGEITVIKSVH